MSSTSTDLITIQQSFFPWSSFLASKEAPSNFLLLDNYVICSFLLLSSLSSASLFFSLLVCVSLISFSLYPSLHLSLRAPIFLSHHFSFSLEKQNPDLATCSDWAVFPPAPWHRHKLMFSGPLLSFLLDISQNQLLSSLGPHQPCSTPLLSSSSTAL